MSQASSRAETTLEGDYYGGPLIAKSSSTADTQKALIYIAGAIAVTFLIYKTVTRRK